MICNTFVCLFINLKTISINIYTTFKLLIIFYNNIFAIFISCCSVFTFKATCLAVLCCYNCKINIPNWYVGQFGQELTSLWLQLNQAVPNVARSHCIITDFRVWMQTKYIRLIDQWQFVNVGCCECITYVKSFHVASRVHVLLQLYSPM